MGQFLIVLNTIALKLSYFGAMLAAFRNQREPWLNVTYNIRSMPGSL